MTSHIYHPDVYTHGLCDDCARCLELALHPVYELDEPLRRRILTSPVSSADHLARDQLLSWDPDRP